MSPTQIQYIGHATTLIKIGGTMWLTDPVFSDRVWWFKRHRPLPFPPEKLPAVDGILLSHVHPDHLDLHSFRYLPSSVPVVVPEGSAGAVERFIDNPIIELSAWSKYNFKDGTTLQPVPMKHCGGRCPYGFRYRNTFGYILQKGSEPVVLFVGDSAYGSHFQDIGKSYQIDCALLPIGGYRPASVFRRVHMSPKEALQTTVDLGAKTMIPIHWGLFRFSLEGLDEPICELKKLLVTQPKMTDRVRILQIGETHTIPTRNTESRIQDPE